MRKNIIGLMVVFLIAGSMVSCPFQVFAGGAPMKYEVPAKKTPAKKVPASNPAPAPSPAPAPAAPAAPETGPTTTAGPSENSGYGLPQVSPANTAPLLSNDFGIGSYGTSVACISGACQTRVKSCGYRCSKICCSNILPCGRYERRNYCNRSFACEFHVSGFGRCCRL